MINYIHLNNNYFIFLLTIYYDKISWQHNQINLLKYSEIFSINILIYLKIVIYNLF
jgi:hypothetical protein